MRLDQILATVHILESLNTRIPFQWTQDGTELQGNGNLDDVKIGITISALTYQGLNGCNLAFTTEQDGMPIETFRNEFGLLSSKIIGAVVNEFNSKLKEYDVDFVCLVAKDHVEKRASLYKIIATKLARENLMHVKTFKYDGTLVTVMIRSTLPVQLVNDIAARFDMN